MATDDMMAISASSTTSLSASILEFRKIHGRTFHNFNTDTEYWFVSFFVHSLASIWIPPRALC